MKSSITEQASLPRRVMRNKLAVIGLAVSAVAMVVLMGLIHSPAFAQSVTLDMGGDGNGTVSGRVIQMIALLTILSLAPSILIMMTSFTRIIVVLSFLRTAIGIQQTPPNTVLISLALFLTFFIMAPTFQSAYQAGVVPLIEERIDETEAFKRTVEPFREFMLQHVRETDLALFAQMHDADERFDSPEAIPLQVIIPAFMISELRRAFEIGFMLFLPFVVIDMVTASILMSMGMMMLPPVMISLPFKIIFFVLVDGWHLLAGTLVQSFDVGVVPLNMPAGAITPDVPSSPIGNLP